MRNISPRPNQRAGIFAKNDLFNGGKKPRNSPIIEMAVAFRVNATDIFVGNCIFGSPLIPPKPSPCEIPTRFSPNKGESPLERDYVDWVESHIYLY